MSDIFNLYLFAELLAGLLLFGQSVSITRNSEPARFSVSVEFFKFILGIILIVLAYLSKAI